ncbi:MAG: gamma-glutamyltransferase family protein [Spirochaetes bacterium]|nr:gamma-glutamyltransferase family protein [Spirochaetota bacterium]
MSFDPHYNPYPSRRNASYAARGMVCCSHPLAAQAGLEILKQGGNAVDAAVAAAAALTVVEPTSNGIGSDAFALVWKDGKLLGMNASGPCPQALDMDTVRQRKWGADDGHLPTFGWAPVTVPGAPAAWAELSRSGGRLGLRANLAPAILLAEEGHAVALTAGWYWQRAFARYSGGLPGLEAAQLAEWFRVFAPGGQAPRPGTFWHSPDHAATLRAIADSDAADFYSGRLATAICKAAENGGGFLRAGDLADFAPEWVEPISVNYKGYQIWELPPNGQGLAALLALNTLAEYQPGHHDDPDTIHHQLEAIKLAFADAHTHIADPHFADIPLDQLLSTDYARTRAALVKDTASDFRAGEPLSGGTVYLCTADSDGSMVSYIQSNYMGFGSGLVVPGTGIALNNRGHCFSLQNGHPNQLQPGKRPYNTIIPGFLTQGDQAVGPFGVMGGFMQPQGHLQVIMNSIDFNMNPQQALDAPRWQWLKGLEAELETGYSPEVLRALQRRGHRIQFQSDPGSFGRGQIIWKHADGGYVGGTEGRTDGCCAVW